MTEHLHEAPLKSCVWELTLRCNARCRLCGSSAPGARSDEMDAAGCVDLALEMADLGLRSVTLSGGEPLLKKGFFEIAGALVRAGVRTDIVSNGLLIDDEMARRIADIPLYGVSLSFDGPDEVHDDLRGVPGCYDKLQRAMEALHRHGVKIGAITHVNQTNLPHLDRLAEALVRSPVSAWRLQLTVPVDATPSTHSEMLAPGQIPAVAELIRRIDEEGEIGCGGSHSIGYFGDCELSLRPATDQGPLAWRGCPAGIDSVGIASNGDVYGCLSLLMHGTRFRVGNTRDRSLTEIWRDPASFGYNREFDPGAFCAPCSDCRFLERCRGGCLDLRAAVAPELRFNDRCLYDVRRRQTVPGPRAAPRRPSVVLLVADGLRPDFLGCYGDGGADTPNLDALAARGLQVRHARSGSPWTAPAVASLLTGTAPHRLGIVKWEQPLGTPTDLFSELAGFGYAVGSFPFDRRHLFTATPQANPCGMSWYPERFVDWQIGHHSRPSMTYLHWWGTHAPYMDRPQTSAQWIQSMRLLCDTLDRRREFAAKLRELYRRAVRHFDQVVLPAVMRGIEQGRGWDDTVLVVTADHGESWCERYPPDRPVRDIFDLHGTSLYEEALRVPLILAGAVEPGVVEGPVSLTDVAPTLARRVGLPRIDFPDGVDLADRPAERTFFSVADRDFVDARDLPSDPGALYSLLGCLRGTDKLVRDVRTGVVEWYDLASDPGERHDLTDHRAPPDDLLAELDRGWRETQEGRIP